VTDFSLLKASGVPGEEVMRLARTVIEGRVAHAQGNLSAAIPRLALPSSGERSALARKKKSEKRLARLLLLLANFGKEGRPEPIVGKFSQETLAEMIGTTRSRVSFFMNKFRKLGFIEYNGKLEVHNSLLNVVLHDNPQVRTRACLQLRRMIAQAS
jgi:CRP-like cAMP-binding protein